MGPTPSIVSVGVARRKFCRCEPAEREQRKETKSAEKRSSSRFSDLWILLCALRFSALQILSIRTRRSGTTQRNEERRESQRRACMSPVLCSVPLCFKFRSFLRKFDLTSIGVVSSWFGLDPMVGSMPAQKQPEPGVEPEIASGSCLMVGRSRDPG